MAAAFGWVIATPRLAGVTFGRPRCRQDDKSVATAFVREAVLAIDVCLVMALENSPPRVGVRLRVEEQDIVNVTGEGVKTPAEGPEPKAANGPTPPYELRTLAPAAYRGRPSQARWESGLI